MRLIVLFCFRVIYELNHFFKETTENDNVQKVVGYEEQAVEY